jgi:hypothetical protein
MKKKKTTSTTVFGHTLGYYKSNDPSNLNLRLAADLDNQVKTGIAPAIMVRGKKHHSPSRIKIWPQVSSDKNGAYDYGCKFEIKHPKLTPVIVEVEVTPDMILSQGRDSRGATWIKCNTFKVIETCD